MTSLLSLSQHAKHKNGTYVAFSLSKRSQDELDDFIRDHLFIADSGVEPDSLHTTVIYSRTPVPEAEHLVREIDTTATCVQYEIFSHSKEDTCLVILIDCPLARKLNDKLTRMGASSDYPVYRAHVTIAKGFDGQVVNLPLPHFALHFDKIIVDGLDETK